MRQKRRELAACYAPGSVACIWIPQFAIRMERARRPELPAGPLVLVDSAATAAVRACSPEASAAGLAVGTPAAAIPQSCPGAVVLPFDSGYYERGWEALLVALNAISPQVEAGPPDVFYLDLANLPHLDPLNPEQVAAAVRAAIPPLFAPRVGVARGKFVAWVAANAARPERPLVVRDEERAALLRQAPSRLLPVSAETARRLRLLGLGTLGSIACLPRPAMLAQFGWEGARAHRLACGEETEPLRPYAAPVVIRESLSFPSPPTVALFQVALGGLLQRACAQPERGSQGVRQVRLEAQLEQGGRWERVMTLRRPAERWEPIFEELKRRLEATMPAGALLDLTVELTALAARLDRQPLLLPDERQERAARLAHELDQLRVRLGSPSVYRIVEVEPWSRLPERRHALLSCEPSTRPGRRG